MLQARSPQKQTGNVRSENTFSSLKSSSGMVISSRKIPFKKPVECEFVVEVRFFYTNLLKLSRISYLISSKIIKEFIGQKSPSSSQEFLMQFMVHCYLILCFSLLFSTSEYNAILRCVIVHGSTIFIEIHQFVAQNFPNARY